MTHLYGPHAALSTDQVDEVTRRARAIMAEHPPSPGFKSSGARQRHLRALAAEYAIDLRTLYRYLRYGPRTTVRVGPWTAVFAVKHTGNGRPVQLSGWIRDGATA